jgi:hypothetical protein
MHSQPPPKGSLEDLFRHHLLESEAAAVPPRPMVWEHIDNSLLLAQNEKYRRRLLVHRWGMAASLLLATLAGGGWWHSQQVATATLASANARQEAARHAVAGAVAPSSRAIIATTEVATTTLPQGKNGYATGTSTIGTATGSPDPSTGFGKNGGATAGRATGSRVASSAAANDLLAYEHAGTTHGQRTAARRPTTAGLAGGAYAGSSAGSLAYGTAVRPAYGAHQAQNAAATRTSSFPSPNANAIAGTSTFTVAGNTAFSPVSQPGTGVETGSAELLTADALATSSATNRSGEDLLAGRLAALALAAPAGLPTALATKGLPLAAPTELQRWRYGAEYAITAFQPNIDFNRGSSGYNSALGLNTVSLTRAAAAEYRANLRPGLGQRLTLRATRWLGGHWSLNTGLEVAQQHAYSATSAAFTGEQLADASYSYASPSPSSSAGGNSLSASRRLNESSFRYRSAGIPIELQYDTQVKSGVSFYGRLGAIVSALLSVRSEVAGNPEATRSYSAFSASSPYRRFTALLRGSAGVRYRPAGRGWGLNVGPTAEAGVQSMNAETDRSFLQQQRPYSVGIEAGFEFGGNLKPVPATN